jgi:lipoate-protein ligase B
MDYQAAWDIQRRLAAARGLGRLSDTLILLEHPHTYTLGRSAHAENLLLDENDRQRLGIALVEVDRGGDITYHGPGQMVAYPIRYLGRVDTEGRLAQVDYVGYLRSLEEALIRTLACFGIGGHREAGYTGVWVATSAGLAKIAAIGVRVSAQGVSTHGAALNVTTDLEYFRGIIPCGIADRPVTSMQMMMGDAVPDLAEVQYAFAQSFAGVFGYQALVPSELAALLS